MDGARRFDNRTDAGKRLAETLRERGVEADLVLAVPRGGLPLGRAVADALEVPLDIVVAKKIGAPGNPEYAVGAVASDGSVWRNEVAIDGTRTDEAYVEERREAEAERARRKADRYRGGRPAPDLGGKTVVVVDDGVATGSTVRACLAQLENSDADRVVLAVPVGPPDTIADLEGQVDDVVCLETPANFMGVGQFYANFGQVSDEEAMAYLDDGDRD
ncbi:phosphoribosyltransferase [Natronolimnohabitans innermongolicus]|uniref:Phosphoribosyltransferase n=1 Tax=Natronolimnohabitans innermongolicus JCM 12255 TaxID=1227499 RepID=L9XAB2_9EURY|nr:phosphoribosyltransferase family protein [Natronolimnohabitans innermongolicus]ELY58694.1 phosphoribosyltransferase [Natronolimnohabitans innermongolicus JCM 12255]